MTLRDIGTMLFTGVGKVIPEIMLLGIGSWAAGYMLRGIGRGQFVELLNILAVFVGFGLVFVTVMAEVIKAFKALGL